MAIRAKKTREIEDLRQLLVFFKAGRRKSILLEDYLYFKIQQDGWTLSRSWAFREALRETSCIQRVYIQERNLQGQVIQTKIRLLLNEGHTPAKW